MITLTYLLRDQTSKLFFLCHTNIQIHSNTPIQMMVISSPPKPNFDVNITWSQFTLDMYFVFSGKKKKTFYIKLGELIMGILYLFSQV